MAITAEPIPASVVRNEVQPIPKPMGKLLRFQTNAEGVIIAANKSARSYLGLPPTGDILPALGLTEAITSPHLTQRLKAQREAITPEKTEVADIVEVAPETYIKVMTEAEFSPDGTPTYETHFVDVTEVVAQERAAARAQAEKAEEEVRLANETVIGIAHDGRTPYTIIKGYTELLEEGLIPESDKGEAHRTIIKQADLGVQIMNDYLELMRMESQGQLELGQVDMAFALNDLMHKFQPEVEEKHATVSYPNQIIDVKGAGPCIDRILANYFSNALKYGGHNPHVEISVERLDGGKVKYSVIDHGNGIPKDRQEELFKKFGKLGLPEHKDIKSVGLGLYLVKRMIELQGGTVGVNSEEGKGSAFYFILDEAQEKPVEKT